MPDYRLRQLIRDEIAKEKKASQYGVSRVPVHAHNGMDSPKIDFQGGLVNRQLIITSHVPGTLAGSAGNYGQFWFNPLNYDQLNQKVETRTSGFMVMTITEIHGQAGTDGGDVLLALRLLNPGDSSISGGTTITTFNLKGTANSPSYSALVTGGTPAVVYPGQRLALQTSGTLTNVADVLVTVVLQY